MNERLYIMMEKIASRGLVNSIYKKVTSLQKSLEKYDKQHNVVNSTLLSPNERTKYLSDRKNIIDDFARKHGITFEDREAGTLADAGFSFNIVKEKFVENLPDAKARAVDAGLQGKVLGKKISKSRSALPTAEQSFIVNPYKKGEEVVPAYQKYKDAAEALNTDGTARRNVEDINELTELRKLRDFVTNRRITEENRFSDFGTEIGAVQTHRRTARNKEHAVGIYGTGSNTPNTSMTSKEIENAKRQGELEYNANKLKSYSGHKNIAKGETELNKLERNRDKLYSRPLNEHTQADFIQQRALDAKIQEHPDTVAAQKAFQDKLKAEQAAKQENARLVQEARDKAEADRLAEAAKAKALEDANREKAYTEKVKERMKELDAELDSKFPTGGGGGNSGGGSTGGGSGGIWSGSGRNTGGSTGGSVGGSTGGSVGGSTGKGGKNYMWPALAGTAAIGGGAYLLHRQSNKDNRDR